MSWKDYLEDYQAREDEAVQRFLGDIISGKIPIDSQYPSVERLGGRSDSVASSAMANIWGVIPFHGRVLLPIPAVSSSRQFDFTLKDWGVTWDSLPDVAEFARETGRIVFTIPGPATAYEKLDSLEPIFREFRPPLLAQLPMARLIGRAQFRGEQMFFGDLAGRGLIEYIESEFAERGMNHPWIIEALLQGMSAALSYMRHYGFNDLAEALETELVVNPRRAALNIWLFKAIFVDPILDLASRTTVLGHVPLTSFHRAREAAGLSLDPPSGISLMFDPCRFLLKQVVLYPETIDGCRRVIELYESSDLARVQESLFKALRENNIDLVAESRENLEMTCQNVWQDVDKYGWVEKLGVLLPSATLGVVGDMASGIPGIGLLSAFGLATTDNLLGGPSGKVFKQGVGRLLGQNHLVALYDFKACLPKKARRHS